MHVSSKTLSSSWFLKNPAKKTLDTKPSKKDQNQNYQQNIHNLAFQYDQKKQLENSKKLKNTQKDFNPQKTQFFRSNRSLVSIDKNCQLTQRQFLPGINYFPIAQKQNLKAFKNQSINLRSDHIKAQMIVKSHLSSKITPNFLLSERSISKDQIKIQPIQNTKLEQQIEYFTKFYNIKSKTNQNGIQTKNDDHKLNKSKYYMFKMSQINSLKSQPLIKNNSLKNELFNTQRILEQWYQKNLKQQMFQKDQELRKRRYRFEKKVTLAHLPKNEICIDDINEGFVQQQLNDSIITLEKYINNKNEKMKKDSYENFQDFEFDQNLKKMIILQDQHENSFSQLEQEKEIIENQ